MAQGYCAIEWSQTNSNSFSVSGDTGSFDSTIIGKIYCNILINLYFNNLFISMIYIYSYISNIKIIILERKKI